MGALFMIIASVLLGTYPTLQAKILDAGASPLGLVILCNAAAGAFALIAGKIRGEDFRIGKKELPWFALTGVAGLFLTDLLLNIAYTMIPVGFVTMIHFFYPSLVCILMVILFREKMSPAKIGAIVLSILGLFCISGGNFSGSMIGVIVALLTAFAYGFYMISNDKSPISHVPIMARTFYINIFVVAAALVLQAGTKRAVMPPTTPLFMMAIGIGCLLSLATILVNAAIARLGAVKASFINMIEPVTSVIVSLMVYHYSMSAAAAAGCLLILGSLILVTKKTKKEKAAESTG